MFNANAITPLIQTFVGNEEKNSSTVSSTNTDDKTRKHSSNPPVPNHIGCEVHGQEEPPAVVEPPQSKQPSMVEQIRKALLETRGEWKLPKDRMPKQCISMSCLCGDTENPILFRMDKDNRFTANGLLFHAEEQAESREGGRTASSNSPNPSWSI